MEKLGTITVVGLHANAVASLTGGARSLADRVTLVYAGSEKPPAFDADQAYSVASNGKGFMQLLPTISAAVRKTSPELVVVEDSANGRLAAAEIVKDLRCDIASGVIGLDLEDGSVRAASLAYGGTGVRTVKLALPAVVCMGNGVFPASSRTGIQITEVPCVSDDHVVLEAIEKKERQTADLASAKRVIGLGRGARDMGVEAVKPLAELIGAELACTRPAAEEDHLLSKSCYVGVSGQTIKPDLYLMLGVSGQAQHMVGASNAGVIIAVNKDKNAPVFKRCDYGIVGDVADVTTKLMGKLA